MRKKVVFAGLCAFVGLGTAVGLAAGPGGGRGNGPIVYVSGQGLFYDSIVVADPLPADGPFQLLEMGGPEGTLLTEFGPGDSGFYGGRWMEDFDGDGQFHYFLCPLLGPGREMP